MALIRNAITAAMVVITFVMTADGAHAQRGERRERNPEADRAWIQETGLMPVFPTEYQCPSISSAFAATTDGAGNRRDLAIHGGKHGGVDVEIRVGNPLIAIASGEVIAKGPDFGIGMQMEGIFLWLRHSPEDTGLPFWTFSKYQHLKEPSLLNVNDRVTAGQVVAIGGDTGTYSQKFGGSLPHLHMSTFIGPSGNYIVIGKNKNMVKSKDMLHVDMMTLFVPRITIEIAQNNPTYSGFVKRLPVSVATWDGVRSDLNAKIIWPVACKSTN